MPIIVKKYGGSSIETIELIDKLAKKLAQEKRQEEDIVVVVSAMAKTTDYLFSLAKQLSQQPYQRELDMLVTAGERISMSLLSIALHKYGVPAISFTGSQSGIITNDCHGNAKIIDVNAFRIKEELQKGKIVIVAGFQGVSRLKEITTLGRGGSDTTAVALAGYLGAERCEMFKDVEGLFTADPKLVKEAFKIDRIGYMSMLFLGFNGCKAVHPRAVQLAMKYDIPVEIKSAFTEKEGTLIIDEEYMNEMKDSAITAAENIIIIDVITTNPAEVIGLINHTDNDIFDLQLLAPDQVRFSVTEHKYLQLIEAIQSVDMAECKITKPVCSVSMTGSIYCEDSDFLKDALSIIAKTKIDLLWLVTNHYGFTVYLKTDDVKEVVKQLHTLIVTANTKQI